MAAELRAKFSDVEIELLPSSKGRFEVLKDGQPIYEKSKTGRHAAPGEIVARIVATE